jgi:hypothetical protein
MMADKRKLIAFGSAAHRELLGLDNDISPEERAKLEAALKTKPAILATKKVIPWLARRGVPTLGGWVKRGE